MVCNREELKRIIKYECQLYNGDKSVKELFISFFTKDRDELLKLYVKYLRLCEFYYNNKNKLFNKIIYLLYRKKRNHLGALLGIEIYENSFDEGLRIWHPGSIVVNGYSRIGKNCQLRGNNCIGNNGYSLEAPVIGDNCSIGFGAIIIGNVKIGNNVIIGAGAVVNRDFLEDNIVIAGVPARVIKKRRDM